MNEILYDIWDILVLSLWFVMCQENIYFQYRFSIVCKGRKKPRFSIIESSQVSYPKTYLKMNDSSTSTKHVYLCIKRFQEYCHQVHALLTVDSNFVIGPGYNTIFFIRPHNIIHLHSNSNTTTTNLRNLGNQQFFLWYHFYSSINDKGCTFFL